MNRRGQTRPEKKNNHRLRLTKEVLLQSANKAKKIQEGISSNQWTPIGKEWPKLASLFEKRTKLKQKFNTKWKSMRIRQIYCKYLKTKMTEIIPSNSCHNIFERCDDKIYLKFIKILWSYFQNSFKKNYLKKSFYFVKIN